MSKRSRVFLGVLLVYAAGLAFLLSRVVADIDPRYRESAEHSLVEASQLLATLVEQDIRGGAIDTGRLQPLFQALQARRFHAPIYSVTKQQIELRAYVTDGAGRVLFDSQGAAPGTDYAQWRDVHLTLRGLYGARTTPDDPKDPASSVMYVAAPIRWQGQVIGVATVGRPERSFGPFVQAARKKTLAVGLLSLGGALLLAFILLVWLARPFGLITDYLRYARSQRSLSFPRLGRRALAALGAAYNDMRDALAGRNYVADYVQTLTHEVKSPLSAIRGAAELLQEPAMDAAQRQRFLANIAGEADRIQEIVDRMMELTALESRRALERADSVALRPLLQDLCGAAQGAAAARGVRIVLQAPQDAAVEGDPFLLRRAVSNLLDNAIDFSRTGGEVAVALEVDKRAVRIRVRDQGTGIPDYARDKVFEKFYSLARPHSRRKSTGLGLAFVREIAALHRGRIELANAPQGGAVATLSLSRL